MTYIYYKTNTLDTSATNVTEKQTNEWKHLSDKANWRITQLPNGYYQTEVSKPEVENQWVGITRRATIDGAESAIDGSVEHYSKKLEFIDGPKVVKTF